MSPDELKQRFTEAISQRARDDKYIDRAEEREILQLAVSQGVTADTARAVLVAACEARGYVVESKLVGLLRDYLDTAAGNDGQIDQWEYRDALTLCQKWTGGRCPEALCKRLIVEIIEDDRFKTARGWFRSWYDRVRQEVGR